MLCPFFGPNQPSNCSLPPGTHPSKCQHESGLEWRSFDLKRLPYKCWPALPSGNPRAVVIMACGWDGVSCDHAVLGERLACEGYTVYSSENRGGKYDPDVKDRGDLKNHMDMVKDLQGFTEFVRGKHPSLPVFYHGHSLGCVVAIVATARTSPVVEGPAGLILHSPAIALMKEKESQMARAFSWILSGVRVKHLQRDPVEMGLYENTQKTCEWLLSDDRVREGFTMRFVSNVSHLGHLARIDSRTLKVPVLALGGGKDGLVTVAGTTQEEYASFLATDIAGGQEEAGGHARSVYYSNGYHILTDGQVKERVLNEIVNWLMVHNSKAVGENC